MNEMIAKERIVVVDDEKDMRDFFEIMLRKEGYDAKTFASARAALEYCSGGRADIVISDIKMPDMGGLEFLKALKEAEPDLPVIMITAYASVDTAIEAMKAGAYDYFTKPFKIEEIRLNIKSAIGLRRLKRENQALKREIKSKLGFAKFIGNSEAMADVYSLIMSVVNVRTNVFITGESGTGKELAARAIHYESDRKDSPFVAVNCGAIPENLLESELFGHQKGAFTGAVANKDGLAEQANGGTLFLDEITELPLHLQVKLLRFIQERVVRRVGGTADIPVDIRLIAASNKDVEKEVKAGRFREDLFYRLNVIRVNMPPLRKRKEDIPLIAAHFVEKYCMAHGKEVKRISEDALRLLVEHDYSGNVRELENIIERAIALEASGVITSASLPDHLKDNSVNAVGRVDAARTPADTKTVPSGGLDLEKTVEDFERAIIIDALKKSGGIKKRAAELLGLSFRSIRYKLSKYGISDDGE